MKKHKRYGLDEYGIFTQGLLQPEQHVSAEKELPGEHVQYGFQQEIRPIDDAAAVISLKLS